MADLTKRPILLQRVNLWWYALAILPIVAVVYMGFSGILSPIIGLIGLFASFFWIFSLGFAIASKLRKPPPDPRQ